MSDLLFPRSRVAPGAMKLRLALVGAVAVVAFAMFAVVLGLQTVGVLGAGTRVTAHLPTVGDSLGINSDVKYRGLRVGRVIQVDPGAGSGIPSAQVVIEDEHARRIPAHVKARVLPGTLFGNEFIDLVAEGDGPGLLQDGQSIAADTSKATIRLMETLAATQRLLASSDPSQWADALSQLAGALDGRGDDLAQFVADANAFLGRWAEQQPQVVTDLRLLAGNAELLADIEPLLMQALRGTRPLAVMLVDREEELAELAQAGTATLMDEEYGAIAFIAEEGPRTSMLLAATAPTLEVFAERSPAFRQLLAKVPAVLDNGAIAAVDGRIQMEGVLAPQFLDPYETEDCIVYRGLPGPNCPGGQR